MSCQLPPASTLLIDVDAMCKLAHWNLLESLPAITGVPPADCATLPSCRHRAAKALTKLDKVFKCVEAATEVLRAVDAFGDLPQPDPSLLEPFQDVAGIDSGEAVMFARMIEQPSAILLTGDKRAMRAAAALPMSVRGPVAARVLPVECVVKCALDMFGLDELRTRVCPWKEVDKAIAIVMGSRCDQPEASVREGLASYLGELAGLCDPPLTRAC